MELGGPLGRALDRWLQHLDSQGFRVGVRERLLIQTLLARQAAQGELPTDLRDMLAIAAPLVCGTREQQRHYGTLLQAFIASDSRLGQEAEEGHERRPASERPRRLKLVLAGGAGLAAVVAALWFAGVLPPHKDQIEAPAPPASAPAPVEPPAVTATEAAVPFIVPALPLPLQPDLPPPWSWPVRAVIGAFAVLALLLWAAALWLKDRRQFAMAGVRTDEELEDHLLRDVDSVDIAPHPVLARTVARALRQRVGGSGRTLDLPSTVRATVAAQGAFTPSWRQLRLTPEYLALVDVRHPHDHHAAAVHVQLDALSRAGVALQVWHYESSPAAGCWLRGGQGNDDPLTRHRVPLAALAARSAGQRLLVFGPADVLQHPFTGLPQSWVSALLPLTERAWITPQPIHAWGAAERLADEAGFLVLPLQEASLTTLAGWFTSRRLTLALDPDSPTSVPTQLQGKALEWVTRGDAPPPETRQALLRQLRAMLGGLRFQWLCGCAIFPALTPPLTLALGHRLLPDARSLALGLAAFCALPWFRWGRMPEWLRRDLLAELAPDIRAQLAAEVHTKLDRALESGSGPAVANVATRKRRLLGALQQRRGPLRDAVLADFVRKDTDPDLAQRLPEGLRRRLFKDGDPAQGLGGLTQGLATAGILAMIVVATPLWPAMVGLSPQPALTPLKSIAVGDEASPASAVRELRAFGETLMLAVRDDGVAAWTDFAPEATGMLGAQAAAATLLDASLPLSNTASDGTSLQIIDGRIQLLGADGRQRGTPLESDGTARVRLAGFSPSGGRVVALMDNGRWQSWGVPWPSHMEVVVACGGASVDSSVASIVTRALTPSTGGLDLNVVTFASNGWRLPSFAASPAAGAVLRTEGYDRDRASGIAERLRGLSSRVPLPPWAVPSVFTPAAGNLLVIGACSPGGSPAVAATLEDRVKSLFAADAGERVDAAAALVADREQLSDAIGPALTLALDAQSRTPVVEPGLSGIINTLVLLKSAPPATLRRESTRIERLVTLSAANGDKTRQEGQRVLGRLKETLSLRPVVHMQIADDAQRPLAEQMALALKASGLQPTGIESVGDKAPSRTEIRVQGFSDRTIARTLRDAARTRGGATIVTLPQTPANDTYEIWLDRDLCHARQVQGCAENTATPAQGVSKEPPSDDLVAMTGYFEGVNDGDLTTQELDAYVDAAGIWMIGYGHPLTRNGAFMREKDYPDRSRALEGLTLTFGPEVLKVSEGLTPDQARALLRADLANGLASVDSLVTVSLTRYQREALGDLVFNLGASTLRSSTLLKLVNSGNFNAVPEQLQRWTVVAGKQAPGLVQRRAAEIAMWEGKNWRTSLPKASAK